MEAMVALAVWEKAKMALMGGESLRTIDPILQGNINSFAFSLYKIMYYQFFLEKIPTQQVPDNLAQAYQKCS